MKWRKIAEADRQIMAIRAQLGDFESPPEEIERPRYPSGRLMSRIPFEKRIEKLKSLENRAIALRKEGLLKWFYSKYRG